MHAFFRLCSSKGTLSCCCKQNTTNMVSSIGFLLFNSECAATMGRGVSVWHWCAAFNTADIIIIIIIIIIKALSVSACASALTRKLLRACFTCLKVLKKRSWNWITKEVRLLVEEKKQTSRILCVQDKAKITTGPSTSTHWRSTDAQNTVSEAHDFAFRALASLSLSLSEFWPVSLCVCVSVCLNLTASCQAS
jgi:hypothetical protein